MAKSTEISAADWLAVRQRVARTIQQNSTVQEPARLRISEALITNGYIDIEYVRDEIRAEEKKAEDLAARNRAGAAAAPQQTPKENR